MPTAGEPDYHDRALEVGNPDGGVPSFFRSVGPPRAVPYPRAALAWTLAVASYWIFLLAPIAMVLGVRAGVKGNRLAWVAVVLAPVLAATGLLLDDPPLMPSL